MRYFSSFQVREPICDPWETANADVDPEYDENMGMFFLPSVRKYPVRKAPKINQSIYVSIIGEVIISADLRQTSLHDPVFRRPRPLDVTIPRGSLRPAIR